MVTFERKSNPTDPGVTLTRKEADFVFLLLTLVNNAYPKLQKDSDFMANAEPLLEKVFCRKTA